MGRKGKKESLCHISSVPVGAMMDLVVDGRP